MTERDDYLWDRSGEPDPMVQRLEDLLAPLAQRPSEAGREARLRVARTPRRRWLLVGALAAAAGVALWAGLGSRNLESSSDPLPLLAETSALLEGDLYEAASGSTASLRLADVGELILQPGTRLRAVELQSDRVLLELERGELSAYVSPSVAAGFFNIDTPATRCVDLGCAYDLSVDEGGGTRVEVTLGRVAFRDGEGEVFVPAGAVCLASPEGGAGTPFFPESSLEWLRALERYDRLADGDSRRPRQAERLIAGAQGPPEALALWHFTAHEDREVAALATRRLTELRGRPELSGGTHSAVPTPTERLAWRDVLWPDPYGE